jgi:hypothetical protein
MKERELPASVAVAAVEPRDVAAQPAVDARVSLAQLSKTRTEANGSIRRATKKRSATKPGAVTLHTRYFLTRSASDGIPELETEVANENQAMIASLKQDRTFVSVTEWRAKIDPDKGSLVIEKEPVRQGET